MIAVPLALSLVAAAAGFVDTIAGGGGLLTLPGLLLAGLPPLAALATNKLQSSSGTLTASLTLAWRGQLSLRSETPSFAGAFAGSLAGAVLVQRVRLQALQGLVPLVLLGVALFYLLHRTNGARSLPRLGRWPYRLLVTPAIGFYDGFFGPGTGAFFGMAEAALRGRSLVGATATAKLLNFASNLAALLSFFGGGKIVWTIGLAMVAGQMAGAWVGAHVMIQGGARLIRPLIVLMCLAMLGRFAWQHWGPQW